MSKEVLDKPRDLTADVKKSKELQDRSREIRIEIKKSRRHTAGPLELRIDRNMPKMSTHSQNYAYVNSAYVGSTHSLSHVQTRIQLEPPIDTVYREQYCVCSRWPIAKKIFAVAVGLLFGAAMGLILSMTLSDRENGIDFPILRSKPD